MVLKTVYTDVSVDVDVDLDDFDTEELCDEVERRGLLVVEKEDSGAMSDAAKDEIFNLYRDYVDWKTFGMTDSYFEGRLKKFFSENLNIVVA